MGPQMILTPSDRKFDETKDEIPPGACRLSKKLKKNNVEKVDPKKVEKKQCRKSGFVYLHILPYTSKSLYTPSHTSTYMKILNIRKMRANIKHKNGHNSRPGASPRVQI